MKKSRPLPAEVRSACLYMVYGREADEERKPLGFIEAAALAGVKPDQMRRWLDKPEVRSFILRERRAFRAALCAGNEMALARVRDRSENAMATVRAVQVLEEMQGEDGTKQPSGGAQGFVIRIVNNVVAGPQGASGTAIDVSAGFRPPFLPEPAPSEPEPPREPVFKIPR